LSRGLIKTPHPGDVLGPELKERGLTPYRLAKDIGVPQIRISEIISGKRSVTPDTALRLERYLGISARFWLNFQASHDLELLRLSRAETYAKIERSSTCVESTEEDLAAA